MLLCVSAHKFYLRDIQYEFSIHLMVFCVFLKVIKCNEKISLLQWMTERFRANFYSDSSTGFWLLAGIWFLN